MVGLSDPAERDSCPGTLSQHFRPFVPTSIAFHHFYVSAIGENTAPFIFLSSFWGHSPANSTGEAGLQTKFELAFWEHSCCTSYETILANWTEAALSILRLWKLLLKNKKKLQYFKISSPTGTDKLAATQLILYFLPLSLSGGLHRKCPTLGCFFFFWQYEHI